MPEHIVFSCPCGRNLRAKADLAGTAIRCWSCHAEVPVPRAKFERRVELGSFVGVWDIVRAEYLLLILLGALVVACTLAIPVVGAAAGLGLLAAAAVAYRKVIRISGLQGAPVPEEPAWRTWAERCVWGPVIALGLTAPVLLRHMTMDSYGRLIHWRGAGVAAAAVLGWIVVPLVVLIASACDRSGPLTVRAALARVWRHAIVTVLGLLILPVGLLILEVALVSITNQQGWFGFLVLDLFPSMHSDRVPLRASDFYNIQFPDHASFAEFFHPYVHGLRLGYTLMGAIPASLPRSPDARILPWFFLSYDWMYKAVKVLFATLTLAFFGLLLAIQARWLGLIPTIDHRRESAASRPPP